MCNGRPHCLLSNFVLNYFLIGKNLCYKIYLGHGQQRPGKIFLSDYGEKANVIVSINNIQITAMAFTHIYIFYCLRRTYSINQKLLLDFTMFQGQADLHFKTITECEPPVHIVEIGVTQRKYNRTDYVLDIIIKTPFEIGDDLTVSFVLNNIQSYQ